MNKSIVSDKKSKKSSREPLIHITKRNALPLWQSILVRVLAILAALVVCSVVTIILTGDNPISIYATMLNGAFGTATITWMTLHKTAILLLISLAVAPAFKMKFWNTGAEGQVLAGALMTAILMFTLGGKIPEFLLIIIIFIGSILAGMLWGLIPAVFKAIFGTNETLFTLMMNYVAIKLIEVFLKIADTSGSNTVGPKILSNGWLWGEKLWGVNLGDLKYLFNIIIVLILTVLIYVYMYFSKHGYEISVVGESQNTAKYIGINVKKVIIRTMALSGALCGLTGFLLVSGSSHSIATDIAGGYGFTAIMVAWLAKFNPFIMVLASLLIVTLDRGAGEVSSVFGLNKSFSDILTGIILFFIIGCEFFIRYRVHFSFIKQKADKSSVVEGIK